MKQQFEQDMKAFLAEAGGVVSANIISPAEFPALVFASAAGDPGAITVLQALTEAVTSIGKASSTKRPALCLCCPSAIRSVAGISMVVLVPERDRPTMSIVSPLCLKCGEDDDVEARALAAYREHFWPSARVIDIHSASGTA